MPSLLLLRGPAGGGKSQQARRLLGSGAVDVLADFTAVYGALTGVERDVDGNYPERESSDPRIPVTSYLVNTVINQALARGLRVVRTTSSSGEDVIRAAEAAADAHGAEFDVETIDPGESVIRSRLARDGLMSDQCETALRRWYRGRDSLRDRVPRG